ncbi:VWA domain-containing protein [Frankia sp. CNm7]|uniref:VWA domain-containing protein n=1 Tax=Frankia nepalensis TaxID=1836974 RepID=UPI00193281CE|nr:VWA domain-containing protein [Frankia nepalensis]MBL7519174.1 VWA domain-containing protein [Frankia nepalensis]
MGTTQLTPGGNAPLSGGPVSATVTAAGRAIDVSAVLLTAAGKVRGDDDLVFFNHPAQDGVRLDGATVTVDITRIPATVAKVVVTASIDAARATAVFDAASTPTVEIVDGASRFAFAPPALTHGETIVLLAEIYRRNDQWKVRAVGQGYATGLAGLASDFGIVVDDPGTPAQTSARPVGPSPAAPPAPPGPAAPPASVGHPAMAAPPPAGGRPAPPGPPAPPPPATSAPWRPAPAPWPGDPGQGTPDRWGASAPPASGTASGDTPALSLEKVQRTAPGLVSLYKEAGVSLRKKGVSGQRAAVYLVMDHSGSMSGYYRNGTMQRLAEQVLGLSANLDDDGVVPLVFFSHEVNLVDEIGLADYHGRIESLQAKLPWGGTNYVPAMRAVMEHHRANWNGHPAFVVFQTDGAPFDRRQATDLLRQTSNLPIFWQFVGFGQARQLKFLSKLDTLAGRVVDNAGFFATGRDPRALTDAELYDQLLAEFPLWLSAARAAGIVG